MTEREVGGERILGGNGHVPMDGGDEKPIQYFSGNTSGKNHLENIKVNGRIIL
jgi:hypothetical protein